MEMSLNILPEDQIKVSLPTIGFIAPDTAFPIVVDFFSCDRTKSCTRGRSTGYLIGNSGNYSAYTVYKATAIAGIILALNSWSCWDRTLYGK